MRYVLLDKVKPGMKAARTIEREGSIPLVTEGVILTDSIISLLKNYGYSGIYIEDEMSEGIDVRNVIDENVMLQANAMIEKIFEGQEIVVDEIDEIVKKMVSDIMSNADMVMNIISMKEYHDYTFSHCVNVGVLAACIAVAGHYREEEARELMISGMLHDIGKMDIPKEILDKRGKLTRDEYEVIKNHSRYGYDRLKDLVDIKSVTRVGVLQHHERWDGSGYPFGFCGEEISLFGRVLAVADVYDAITNDRPYHKGMLPEDAMRYMLGQRDIMFDKEIVNMLSSCIAVYPPGTVVRLSNKKKAVVVANHVDDGFRPLVRLWPEREEIDLREFPDIRIMKIL